MNVYTKVMAWNVIRTLPSVPVTHPVVTDILDNYKLAILADPKTPIHALDEYEQNRQLFLKNCTHIAGPELEKLTYAYNWKCHTAFILYSSCFITAILTDTSSPFAVILVLLATRKLYYRKTSAMVESLRFFETCLLEVDNRDEMIAKLQSIKE